jgi:hypothetical protein
MFRLSESSYFQTEQLLLLLFVVAFAVRGVKKGSEYVRGVKKGK